MIQCGLASSYSVLPLRTMFRGNRHSRLDCTLSMRSDQNSNVRTLVENKLSGLKESNLALLMAQASRLRYAGSCSRPTTMFGEHKSAAQKRI